MTTLDSRPEIEHDENSIWVHTCFTWALNHLFIRDLLLFRSDNCRLIDNKQQPSVDGLTTYKLLSTPIFSKLYVKVLTCFTGTFELLFIWSIREPLCYRTDNCRLSNSNKQTN